MKKLLALISLSIFLLAACADIGPVEPTDTQQEAKVDSQALCDAFSRETITSIVGTPYLAEAMEELDSSTGGCKVYNTEDDRLYARNFNLIARVTEDAVTAENEFNRAKAVWENGNMVNKSLKEIENIGTQSFWAYGQETTQLITFQDDNLIILTLGHYEQTEEEILEKAKELTSKALKAL